MALHAILLFSRMPVGMAILAFKLGLGCPSQAFRVGCFRIMTASAIRFGVFSRQGIGCSIVINLVVAVIAFAVDGFIAGAVDDFAGDRCFDRRVAFFAADGFMEAFQRKARFLVGKTGCRLEMEKVVAFPAVGSELMAVKIRMAGNTFRRQRPIPDRFPGPAWKRGGRFLVTVFALDLDVSPLELVGGIDLMVETEKGGVKSQGGMALITTFGELPEMNILMAIDASRLDRPVQNGSSFRGGQVAFFTGDFQVFSRQRVAGFEMV